MAFRRLKFDTIDDAIAELQRLSQEGYTQHGNWNLAQISNHCAYFITGIWDGYPFKIPWLMKVLLGKSMLKKILRGDHMKEGQYTPQKPVPTAEELNEAEEVQKLISALEKLREYPEKEHAHPFFGHMTREQLQRLHTIHAAHHLNFLEPKAGAA